MNLHFPRFGKEIHIVIGGAICFLAINVFLSTSQVAIRFLLFRFNCLGLLVFSEVTTALSILMLATAYLPSGFCGGLYTGYKIKENLRIILIFPALIGFAGLLILRIPSGYGDLSNLNIVGEIFMPLSASIAGSYVGGYTISPKEEKTDPEKK